MGVRVSMKHSKPCSSQLNRGFTLIEILLVLSLLAGAGFVLWVKLPLQVEKQNLATASTQLVQELRNVRQMAMAENTWYRVEFYPSTQSYKVLKEGQKLIRKVTLPKNITYYNYPSYVTFNALGTVTFSGFNQLTGTISLTNGKERRDIIIALITGRVREEIK